MAALVSASDGQKSRSIPLAVADPEVGRIAQGTRVDRAESTAPAEWKTRFSGDLTISESGRNTSVLNIHAAAGHHHLGKRSPCHTEIHEHNGSCPSSGNHSGNARLPKNIGPNPPAEGRRDWHALHSIFRVRHGDGCSCSF
jgi:hypothetical protein